MVKLFYEFKILIDYFIVLFLMVIGFSNTYTVEYDLESISFLLAGFKAAMMIHNRNDKDLLRDIERLIHEEKTGKTISEIFGIEQHEN